MTLSIEKVLCNALKTARKITEQAYEARELAKDFITALDSDRYFVMSHVGQAT